MVKNEMYYFHQTPENLAIDLINKIRTYINDDDLLFEPFKGEGSFYNNFPINNPKIYTEIEEDLDYTTINHNVDWVISNPPFKIDGKNKFYELILHFINIAQKGIIFLCNDYCVMSLTPKRIKEINNRGFFITKMIVCNVKKWRGRYYFIVFTKNNNNFISYLDNNY